MEDSRFAASSWIGGGVGVGDDDEAEDRLQLNRNEDVGRSFNNLLTPRNVFAGGISLMIFFVAAPRTSLAGL